MIIVIRGTTQPQARQLGDNFVRMVKSLRNDTPPGRDIGAGKYDYLIGIDYPDGTQVILGAKASFSTRISW